MFNFEISKFLEVTFVWIVMGNIQKQFRRKTFKTVGLYHGIVPGGESSHSPRKIFFTSKCFLNILDEAVETIPSDGIARIYIGTLLYIYS